MDDKFKITCRECGCDKVQLLTWHNGEEEGVKLKCPACGASEKY